MRVREVLALLLALATVAGLGWLGYDWLLRTTDPDRPPEQVADGPQETVTAYLDAWRAGDLEGMRQLVSEVPEGFDQRHRQMWEAFDTVDFDPQLRALREPEDGRAVAELSLTLTPAGAPGPVSWDSEVELTRTRGVWSIRWSLSVLHPELRPTWEFAAVLQPVPRRPILAVDGTELASDDGRWVGFVPGGIDDPDRVVAAFERALPGSGAVATRELGRGQLVDDWFYPVVLVSQARAEAAWETLRRTPGIVEPRVPPEDQRRVLLDLDFARHVVGVIGEATAEQLEQLAAEGVDAPVGTRIPQFGLEAAFDDQLTGSEELQVGLREIGGSGLTVVIDAIQADPSEPVTTTLDVAIQRAVENALDGVDTTAAIVVVDGSDGAIRASASRPVSGFDRARAGRYPPGSTFKTVTLEAALAAGRQLDDEVACPARTVVGGLAVTNAGQRDLGTITLGRAFAESCNTTFASLATELGADALQAAAERFGFGTEPLHPLEAFGGSFPAPADTAELAAAAFGQARVEASPLHLAAMAAAVASGTWHQPYLLTDQGPGRSLPLATGTGSLLREAYLAAVSDGTGTAAAVEGAEVGGKTGTAQAAGGASHAWFVGTVEGLGFAVLVEQGGSGAEVAAPLAARFVQELLRLRSGDLDPADPAAGPARDPEPVPDQTQDTDTGEPEPSSQDGPTVRPEDG